MTLPHFAPPRVPRDRKPRSDYAGCFGCLFLAGIGLLSVSVFGLLAWGFVTLVLAVAR